MGERKKEKKKRNSVASNSKKSHRVWTLVTLS